VIGINIHWLPSIVYELLKEEYEQMLRYYQATTQRHIYIYIYINVCVCSDR
jgi:hypothetical protein